MQNYLACKELESTPGKGSVAQMAIKVVFPLCSSFCTRLLYNLDQVETCLAIYTDYNTFHL